MVGKQVNPGTRAQGTLASLTDKVLLWRVTQTEVRVDVQSRCSGCETNNALNALSES